LWCAGLTANARAKRQSSCHDAASPPKSRSKIGGLGSADCAGCPYRSAILYSAWVAEREAHYGRRLFPMPSSHPQLRYRDPRPIKIRAPAHQFHRGVRRVWKKWLDRPESQEGGRERALAPMEAEIMGLRVVLEMQRLRTADQVTMLAISLCVIEAALGRSQ